MTLPKNKRIVDEKVLKKCRERGVCEVCGQAGNDMSEIWKYIPGYEGLYQASSYGNIKSLERFVDFRGSKKLVKQRLLKPSKNPSGYYMVVLYNNSEKKTWAVHRVVILSFTNNLENLPEINHKDGIKTNNNIDNLEWVTSSRNHIHCLEKGLLIPIKGEETYNHKLTDEAVRDIRANSLTQGENAIKYGVGKSLIKKVRRREAWKHVS